jgi:hypothetical protein
MHIPPRIARRKIRLLQSELQMLHHYYFQIVELHEEYKNEYLRDLTFFTNRAGEITERVDDESTAENEHKIFDLARDDPDYRARDAEYFPEKAGPKKSEAPGWARKLFKKIALMTHPDRISDDGLREKLRQSFLRASKALEAGKLDDLIGVAVELDIEADMNDEALIPLLTTKIKNIREDIATVENTEEWQWGESLGVPSLRAKMLRTLLSSRGFSLTEEQAEQLLSERGEP